MVVTKAIAAPKIMSGFWLAEAWWDVFYPDQPKPQRKTGESISQYHDRVARHVKDAVCQYMTEQFQFTERMSAIVKKPKGDAR